MDKIKLHDKVFVKYIDSSVIAKTVYTIAKRIENDYSKDIPLFLIVLDGAIVFASDLIRQIQIPVEICSIKCSSYQGMQSTQSIKEVIGLNRDITNRRIIIVEDIVDTGLTIRTLWKKMEENHVKDVQVATFTLKKDIYKENLPVKYTGKEVENKFIVGYGMDYNGLGRNLQHIYKLDE